jgi:hypothetical protein
MSVQPCQNDSLKTALPAKQTTNGISLFYSYTKYNQLTKSTTRNSQFVILNYSYDYHISGQIATATTLTTESTEDTESYEWDGLALIKRGTTNLTNEPAVTGGNPILADNNVLFNDMLGTTLGVIGSKGEKSFASTAITVFGGTTTFSALVSFSLKGVAFEVGSSIKISNIVGVKDPNSNPMILYWKLFNNNVVTINDQVYVTFDVTVSKTIGLVTTTVTETFNTILGIEGTIYE